MLILVLSLFFAFVLGFSAHRTGICTVAAVGEVITSKTARTFASFLKVIFWVILVNGIAVMLVPELLRPYSPVALSLSVVLGGFVFGVGAGINGGCSFATISKIAQGDLHVALTLPAFVLGAFSLSLLTAGGSVGEQNPGYTFAYTRFPTPVVLVLLVWAVYELVRLIRPVLQSGGYEAFVSKRYRLSTGAALMGVCSGFLYLIHGRWAYSSKIMTYVADTDGADSVSGATSVYLILALLTGAIVSAISNRALKLSFAGDKWQRNLSGGFVMGVGAALVPGGNGKLILHDLPHASAHAILAYLAMVVGIALILLVQKRLFGRIDVISCAGDECSVSKG